jgi:hypothetical protein
VQSETNQLAIMCPVEAEIGIGLRLCPTYTAKGIVRYGYVVACEGNLDVSVYFFGELIVFPGVEEFLDTRFGVQPDFHLPGTAGR